MSMQYPSPVPILQIDVACRFPCGAVAYWDAYIFWSAVACSYALTWDFTVDWGLLRPHARHPYLRDELILKRKWIYFCSMALNTLLRMLWITKIVPGVKELVSQDENYLAMCLASLEIVRRCHWNFYRMENVHLKNGVSPNPLITLSPLISDL